MNAPLPPSLHFDVQGLVHATAHNQSLDAFHPALTTKQWELFGTYLQPFAVQQGQVLIQQNASDRTVYFVETGANQRGSTVLYDRDYSAISLARPEPNDDDSADSELVFTELEMNFVISTGPVADVEPTQEFTVEDPFWVGADPEAALSVITNNKSSFVFATVDITGHQGSWDVPDPADPPRLQGSLQPGPGRFQLLGDFDAVFCDKLVSHIIAE